MAVDIQVVVPTENYNHRDNSAAEYISSGYIKYAMDDETDVYLFPSAIKSILDAYIEGKIKMDDEGEVILPEEED